MKKKNVKKWLIRQSEPYRVEVNVKSPFFQKFCKHDYVQGELSDVKHKSVLIVEGDLISIVCVKCGHTHSAYFRRTGDVFF